jgi:hypothetical protein
MFWSGFRNPAIAQARTECAAAGRPAAAKSAGAAEMCCSDAAESQTSSGWSGVWITSAHGFGHRIRGDVRQRGRCAKRRRPDQDDEHRGVAGYSFAASRIVSGRTLRSSSMQGRAAQMARVAVEGRLRLIGRHAGARSGPSVIHGLRAARRLGKLSRSRASRRTCATSLRFQAKADRPDKPQDLAVRHQATIR